MGIRAKIISSLEKVFIDDQIDKFNSLSHISAFKNERISFQLAVFKDDHTRHAQSFRIKTDFKYSKNVSIRLVKSVPVSFAAFPAFTDGYLRTSPGLYPDLLLPLFSSDTVSVFYGQITCAFIQIDGELECGVYPLTVELINGDTVMASCKLDIEIINCCLPKQKTYFTQWFHYDCLANYYNVEPFTDRYFEILKNFVTTAVRNGINTILTPVVTPPLDTAINKERRTTQLVTVYKNDGEYSFDLTLFDRFVRLCLDCGIEHFEICHLFTQWGARACPKVMAYENGEYKRIFGWDTDSCSEEYRKFLRCMLTQLKKRMAELSVLEGAIFHISDEPPSEMAEKYSDAKNGIKDILCDVRVYDALSDINFYKSGIIDNPIPSIDHAMNFIQANVKDLWVYYCSGQYDKVSNRFIAMPSSRTRILGIQMYKYNIKGFLHWGYNFYSTNGSLASVNPYVTTDGDNWVPAGDTFSVYPASDGTAYESLRLCVFYDALQDIRALELAEEYIGREAVLSIIDSMADTPITFKEYPLSQDYIITLREKINNAVKEKLNG